MSIIREKVASLGLIAGQALTPEMLHLAAGLATLGAGGGLTSAIIDSKPLSATIKDIATGAIGGAAGGGTLGSGLALIGKSLPAGNILARNPLGLILTMAGLGAGIGSFLKGGNPRSPEAKQQIAMENMRMPMSWQDQLISESKISSYSKQGNILREVGSQNMEEGAEQFSNENPIQYDPSFEQQHNDDMTALKKMSLIHALRQQQMQNEQEEDRRVYLGRSIGAPIGSFLGKQGGKLLSYLAGERDLPGIRGKWFGMKEKVIDPETAMDVGQAIGNIGGGTIGANIARRVNRNPAADNIMDQLGL